MNDSTTLAESEFHRRVDALLDALEEAVDAVDADIDSEKTGGILTLTFADRSKVIVNRQTPNREIWVAAKSGGFHFRYDGAVWRDTRSGDQLDALLSRVVSMQCEREVMITLP